MNEGAQRRPGGLPHREAARLSVPPGAARGRSSAWRAGLTGLGTAVLALASLLGAAPPALGSATGNGGPAPRSGGVPFELVQQVPSGGRTGVTGTTRIVLTFSHRLATSGPLPTISPPTPGTWTRSWNHLVFVPKVAFAPDTKVTVSVDRGPASPRDLEGGSVVRSVVSTFTVGSGSLTRAEQLLAELDYLPVRFLPASPAPLGAAAAARAAFVAPPGRFVWAWDAPATLRQLFGASASPVLLRGALISFQRANHLPETGSLDAKDWQVLLRDERDPSYYRQPGGYTYALAEKGSPETLTVWDDGKVVVSTPANTGISEAPTSDGTFPVYERLSYQVMKGVDPWGGSYADPVSFVAYFNGSDAVHYIARSSYGYPQSLGCVEVPYQAAEAAWPYLRIGTLVTVAG